MNKADKRQAALDYHAKPRPGKLGIAITKPFTTPSELSLAYSPGVAEPVLEIEKNPDDAFKYTSKGNLVAVITNGTAVLGLGRTGPLASKPVMEGKAVLFKKFANVDVFDIEVDAPDAQDFIETVQRISPTFGGINLEDIAAPDCFHIEKTLSETLDIPVFHDDQHGTAIIICAGLLNALAYQNKALDAVRIVCVGAGAAGIASMKLLQSLGAAPDNIVMCDSKGVVHTGRDDLNPQKQEFAIDTDLRTLSDAMAGADVFIGVSGPGLVSQDMVRSMAPNPVVFALANPTPEILPEEAHAVRDDVIMATGRSDYPNQVNNVLCFPFLFRGALDVRSRSINHEMQIAAVHAIADLARQPVPEVVKDAYDMQDISFGPNYILPTPLDPRLSDFVSPAVAAAAVDSGAARTGYPAHYPKR